jgi:hypothetical protein
LKNFYDLLSVARDASADDIKKAFRREIARYHPDKVQHLGLEFQEMAAGIAADLTEAYRILMDPDLRARYDAELSGGPAQPSAAPPPAGRQEPAASPVTEAQPPPPPPAASPRATTMAGLEFVRKASLTRLREAIDLVVAAEPFSAPGFDIAVTQKAKRGLFRKAEDSLRLLAKFVPQVDADAVAGVWPGAMKAQAADTTLCVLLMGPGLAPARDLAAAVTEQRRKGRTTGPVLVPVDVRDWDALFPPDTPAPVRTLIQRLKDEKR